MSTSPVDGAISPAATLSKVDLPQPVGPTMATNSPSLTASELRSTPGQVPPSASRKVTTTCDSATAADAAVMPLAYGAVPAPSFGASAIGCYGSARPFFSYTPC